MCRLIIPFIALRETRLRRVVEGTELRYCAIASFFVVAGLI